MFRYSINKVAKENLNTLLKDECGVEFSDFHVKYPGIEDRTNIYQASQHLSVRDIQKILSKYDENLSLDIYEFRTAFQIQKSNSLTKLISILRLMGFDVEEIKQGIFSLPDEVMLNCIGCYLLDIFEVLNGPFIYHGSCYSLKSNIMHRVVDRVEFRKLVNPIASKSFDNDDFNRSINRAFEHV